MITCSVFEKFYMNVGDKPIVDLMFDIQNGKHQSQIEEIRHLIRSNKIELASIKKKDLLAFTPSAVFSGQRLLKSIKKYTQIVHLDFDKLTQEELNNGYKIICNNPYTLYCFVSPSGNGLKVFVEVDSGLNDHQNAYFQVMNYYENLTEMKADQNCKDITRLCFVSHDPNIFINSLNQKFLISNSNNRISINVKNDDIEYINNKEIQEETQVLFENQILFTNKKNIYTDGKRNKYIYQLACNCNRHGILQQETEILCINKFDLEPAEIKATVKSAYKSNKNEFVKFVSSAKLEEIPDEDSFQDSLKNSPTIPEKLCLQFPEILKKGATVFKEERERDVFITGALSILSGCLPGVKGVYSGNEVFPNIFSFSIAPAASGKGALKFAKMLADEYHDFVLKESRDAEVIYNNELLQYNQKIKNKKKGDNSIEEPPLKPLFRVVFIPANTSYAKILWHMEQNKGTGIICETEADTLSNVFKHEWGGYLDLLLKSFHHEKLSSSRKGNNEFIEVNSPRLSIALSGTPNQVAGLIASSEDGLFSRLVFYVFKVNQIWIDPSPNGNNINLTDYFKLLSKDVFKMVQFLENSESNVTLSNLQWQKLNRSCEAWLNEVTMFTSEEAASVVKRIGLIMYRIAMIFTAMRKYENGDTSNKICCTDVDFNSALQLAEIYLQHSIFMFNNLPKQSEVTQFKTGNSKRKFFDSLPDVFTRHEAVEIGKKFQLSTRTVDELLHITVGKALEKLKAGVYRKI